ncbi:hypothetical protein LCGC14_0833300 [marine sediment metagenome]|uniref:Uncharacterized protein n=1 Tax=marine sediment metagenome TaxID=412755 RepID=A0A0F9PFB1_9ZZZZ
MYEIEHLRQIQQFIPGDVPTREAMIADLFLKHWNPNSAFQTYINANGKQDLRGLLDFIKFIMRGVDELRYQLVKDELLSFYAQRNE